MGTADACVQPNPAAAPIAANWFAQCTSEQASEVRTSGPGSDKDVLNGFYLMPEGSHAIPLLKRAQAQEATFPQ